MGIVHVLTGPDHLSALATLSANIGNFQAFWYGVRWGIGHSVGLILVGSILIIIDYYNHGNGDNDINNDGEDSTIGISKVFENFCESLVGIFMILLGIYGLRSTFLRHKVDIIVYKNPNEENEERGHDNDDNNQTTSEDNDDVEDGSTLELSPSHRSDDDCNGVINNDQEAKIYNGEASISLADVSSSYQNHHHHGNRVSDFIHHHHNCGDDDEYCCSFCGNSCNLSKPILSLCIGIVHGVAGPGGVLGVLPAVQLHDFKLAVLYLSTFCVFSTITMGVYAALYGTLSSYISNGNSASMEYKVELFSSGLSLFVGILWLVLLSIGKLHDIFP